MDAKDRANFINSVAAEPANDPAVSAAPKKQAEVQSLVRTPDAVAVQEQFDSIFAEGLPAWSIEPPQILVRRRKNRI